MLSIDEKKNKLIRTVYKTIKTRKEKNKTNRERIKRLEGCS